MYLVGSPNGLRTLRSLWLLPLTGPPAARLAKLTGLPTQLIPRPSGISSEDASGEGAAAFFPAAAPADELLFLTSSFRSTLMSAPATLHPKVHTLSGSSDIAPCSRSRGPT